MPPPERKMAPGSPGGAEWDARPRGRGVLHLATAVGTLGAVKSDPGRVWPHPWPQVPRRLPPGARFRASGLGGGAQKGSESLDLSE